MKPAELTIRDARRLALARGGLLKPEWTNMPQKASGQGKRALTAAMKVIRRFGYLQLDTVSIAGARSHTIVLLSRLQGMHPELGETLLQPDGELFEYWGHEASWMPLELYPAMHFRRLEYKTHPWWGDVVSSHPKVVRRLRQQIRKNGPIRSADMEGRGSRGWWDLKVAKRVASALWSSGELAIRERKNFLRSYDFSARVIPPHFHSATLSRAQSFDTLLLQASSGHGWATRGTMASTFRLVRCKDELDASLSRLVEKGLLVLCNLVLEDGKMTAGFVRPEDLVLAGRLARVRPRSDQGVLLSPFDPVLWDRLRVQRLFKFDQVLEIFKPAPQRRYGYYCLPVLAGDQLVSRVDLKADKKQGRIRVLSCRYEGSSPARPSASARQATRSALQRYSQALALKLVGMRQ